MEQHYSWSWVQAQVAQTIDVWNRSAATSSITSSAQRCPCYDRSQQQQRERAYDEGLRAVERELKRPPKSVTERIRTQNRVIASFARFSATALDLKGDTVKLLTDDFLPVGTKLARWARGFDPALSMAEIIQASRNAWTACGLQPLFGQPMELTPSILAYSLLYPYSDNYLDGEGISPAAKRRFCERFRDRLRGETLAVHDHREAALWALVGLIESQYPRAHYPQVYDCLLAIHRAQQESIAQIGNQDEDADLLRMSCAKGGTSVLADACLARGLLTEQESRFAFEWGVLLQLGDDLQDLRDDMRRGSATLFSRAAAAGTPLDSLTMQLLNFSEQVARRMDDLPSGTTKLKALLRMSWRSLILRAMADSHEYFSAGFLAEAERGSPFRFDFLRSRNDRLASRHGLYSVLFEAFLQAPEGDDNELPSVTLSETSTSSLLLRA